MSTVTSKGQVTIPKGIRESLGLKEGDSVLFSLEQGHLIVKKDPRRGILSLAGVGAVRKKKGGGK